MDVAAAVTGRVPEAGLHTSSERRARLAIRLADDVPDDLRDDDSLYPVLGIVVGRLSGGRVPVIVGLPPGQGEDRLKALGAAAASSGSVALFHAVGSTPEAATLDEALMGGRADDEVAVTMADLRDARTELGGEAGGPITAVSLGTPHASATELAETADLLAGRRVAAGVELVIATSRDVLLQAEASGVAARLREAGAELLVDTCTYISPILRSPGGPVMTDSGKWAFYAPANIGATVVLGSRRECVESAVAGRVVRDTGWGSG
jgi:predicted aconitase